MPATAAQPDPATLWTDAERLFAERRLDEAEPAYRALADVPSHAALANVRLSMIGTLRGRCREEVDAAIAAFQARLPSPQILQVVGARAHAVGEVRAMLACAIDPVVVDSGDARVYAELGRTLTAAHFPVEALELLERARTGGFMAPTLRYLIGLCRSYLGQDDVAAREFEATLAQAPNHAPSLNALTRLHLPEGGEARIERLRAAVADPGLDPAHQPMLQYALFEELDRLDRTDDAWEAMAEGMRLRRLQVDFNEDAQQELFDHLATLREPAPAAEGAGGPRPVFIVGMPGAESSLLEKVLGHHEWVADCGELPDFVQQLRWCCDRVGAPKLDLALAQAAEGIDFAELGTRYLSHTWWRGGDRKVYTDRTPSNYMNVSYILRALPHAKILHMVRGPMDTCFASLSGNDAAYSNDQLEMAGQFRRYRTLMAHWRAQYPDRILDVRYEELVEKPDEVMREVLAFCGLEWQDGITDIAGYRGAPAAASDNQGTAPIDASKVDRWRRYEQHLGPLKERLGALAY
jgi:tetratricopeptide (TPR) repeat protein